MISRQWRGLAKIDCSSAYVEHLRTETFPMLRHLRGFLSAVIYQRTIDQGIEFVVETRWDSLEAIRAFSGENTEAAVVPPKVRDMMLDYDTVVRNYSIVE